MEAPLLYTLHIFSLFLACALTGLQGLSSTLSPGNSVAVENEHDNLVSPNGTFTSGFYKVGTNAYCFSIWFTNSADKTVVWMANRDTPVNGKQSKLTLYENGNLVLLDADGSTVWSTNTASNAQAEVRLLETVNLVVVNEADNVVWESFGFPTDTLLATQRLTMNTTLVSMRGKGTYLSGFYFLKFDDNNVLNLLYTGPMNSSVYWPDPASTVFENGRTPYIGTKVAVLDEIGSFTSTDSFSFNASDYGIGPKRRLTLDYDGILRLYSLDESNGSWKLTWRPGGLNACMVRGLCGFNGICIYNPLPTCICPSGFYRNDPSDWSRGCSRLYNLTCDPAQFEFLELPKTDYYGNDLKTYAIGITFETCRDKCLNDCECKGFGYALDGTGECFPKGSLRTGNRKPSNRVTMHLKVPKGMIKSFEGPVAVTTMGLNCSNGKVIIKNNSAEEGKRNSNRNGYMTYLIAFAASVAGIEMICIGLGWWYVFRYHAKESVEAGYIALALGFKRFTYLELKRATKNFKVQIGKGGFGTVYKGVLEDERVVAVKRLEGVLQGDAQFWAEVSIIGKLNHRNLVKLWGFCAENEHKILVYEYVDNGSLDKMLFSDSPMVLEWDQRYKIAVGTAKGLSYLHEECLEWVLHCDVKPQNILIDSQFEPKVADFGMSMLFKDGNDKGFSKVRGTRGYLAPEWMMNQKIDAKADVYSYGMVLLELLTGKIASGLQSAASQDTDLVDLVTASIRAEELEKIIDPKLKGKYKEEQLKRMVEVALLCIKDDPTTRPAMSKVIELLIGNDELKPDEDVED
ncbi:hypothetical protein PTKIN_Ptkin06aG0016600 [Pterospermum kingtungense]